MKFPGENHLKRIGPVSWKELFQNWEKLESTQAGWIRHYRERGYSSWREWRIKAFSTLRPASRRWTLYHIEQPEKVIPQWFGGPFNGWRKYYYRRELATFRTVAKRQLLEKNGKVQQIYKKFPPKTRLMGVMWRGRVVIVEGMHRCSALALAAQRGRKISGEVTIALTHLSGTMPELSSGYKYSSTKK